MPLGTVVGLGPGHILCFMRTQLSPKRGAQQPPIFDPCLLWPNRWMDHDATYEWRARPRPHCVRWNPARPVKGHSTPLFSPMSIVAKRSPISATAELLYKRSPKNFSVAGCVQSLLARLSAGRKAKTAGFVFTQSFNSVFACQISPSFWRDDSRERKKYKF